MCLLEHLHRRARRLITVQKKSQFAISRPCHNARSQPASPNKAGLTLYSENVLTWKIPSMELHST